MQPCRLCPLCWRCAAFPTSTEASWWGPSLHYAATSGWWRGSSPTALESLQTGKRARKWWIVKRKLLSLLCLCKISQVSSVAALLLTFLPSLLPSLSCFCLFQCYTGYEEVCPGFSLPGDICNIQSLLHRQLLLNGWVRGENDSMFKRSCCARSRFSNVRQVTASGYLSYCLKCKTMSFPQAQPFWYRCVFILLWAKVILYKYVSCWVIAVSSLSPICKYVHEKSRALMANC